MKKLVGKVITKEFPFMGEKVKVKRLSVADVTKIQEVVKKYEKSKDDSDQIKMINEIVRMSVIDAEELSDEDFMTFPLAELTELVNNIMEYAGLGGPAGN